MKDEKDFITINPRTGKPFPEKFIASMKKNARRFCQPRTEEEKKNISIKQKEIQAKKRTFREVARMLLEMKPDAKTIKKLKDLLPEINEQEITNRLAMTQKMVEKALNGDNYAFQVIRDTAGEQPVQKQEVIGTVANTYTQVDKDEIKQALIDAKKVLNELK